MKGKEQIQQLTLWRLRKMLRLLKLRKRITLSVGRGLRVGNKGFNLA